MRSQCRACESSTSAVSRGALIRASSRSFVPCRRAVWTVTLPELGYAYFFALRLHLFRLIVLRQRFDDRIETAVHHLVELVQRQPDAMVGQPVLRKIVGADLFTSVAGPHHAPPLRAQRGLLLLQFHLVKPRAQHALRFRPVLDLRLLVLT